MNQRTCPVCGSPHACKGTAPLNERAIITTAIPAKQLPRVPKMTSRIGKASYVGAVELYDPRTPNINFVPPEEPADSSSGSSVEASSATPSAEPPAIRTPISDEAPAKRKKRR